MKKLAVKNKWLFSLLIMALAPQILFSQTEKETIRLMQKTYAEAKSFSLNVKLQLFTNLSDPKPLFNSQGKVLKQGENYYSEMMGRTTLVNEKCCLLIDKQHMTIVYGVVDARQRKSKEKEDLAVVNDTSILEGAVLKSIRKTAQEEVIEIKYENHQIYEKIEMSIEPSNHTLLKLVYFYRSSPEHKPFYAKAIIDYSNIQINTPIASGSFSETRFVSVSKEKVVPGPNFTGYEVIDQRKYNKMAEGKK